AIPARPRLERLLRYLLDETEFLSPWGIRSLSRIHASHPFECQLDGQNLGVSYMPGESTIGIFGGNSNWRARVVPDQLPPRGCAGALPPLLRRRPAGGAADGLGASRQPAGGGARDPAPPGEPLPPRRRRPTALPR